MKSKKTIKFFSIVTLIVVTAGLCFYFNYFKDNVEAKPNETGIIMNSEKTIVKKLNSKIRNPIDEISDLKISYLGHNIAFSSPILHQMQRYYVPINEFVTLNNGTYEEYENKVILKLNNEEVSINLSNNTFDMHGVSKELQGKSIKYNSILYLSINDIEYLFSLRTSWNLENKTIDFLKYNRPIPEKNVETSSEIAVIRIEDVSAGDGMLESQNLEYFKTFIDYMYENNFKFNLGWVPRFVNPESNIDNNLLDNFNIENACFINLLDYCIYMNGKIGLHGYTHQYGNEKSISGIDLDQNVNSSDYETRRLIENAISTAETLNIPISFFESAHYRSSTLQKRIVAEYFKYAYEPYSPIFYNIPFQKNGTLFVPAPLGYVQDHNVDPIIKKLNKKPKGMLASFFYHPSKEFGFIEKVVEGDYVKYNYSNESPMHKIGKALKDNNYRTVSIDSL